MVTAQEARWQGSQLGVAFDRQKLFAFPLGHPTQKELAWPSGTAPQVLCSQEGKGVGHLGPQINRLTAAFKGFGFFVGLFFAYVC